MEEAKRLDEKAEKGPDIGFSQRFILRRKLWIWTFLVKRAMHAWRLQVRRPLGEYASKSDRYDLGHVRTIMRIIIITQITVQTMGGARVGGRPVCVQSGSAFAALYRE